MTGAINFIIESGVSLALLTVIYMGFLRKETFFRMNRLFLLGSLIFSLILPLLHFRVLAPRSTMLAEVTVTPYRNMIEAVTIYSRDFTGSVEQAVMSTKIILFAYLAGVVFFLCMFMFRVLQLTWLIRRSEVQKRQDFKLVLLDRETSPFSFLDYIFVSRNHQQTEGYTRMVAHELEHVKQGHSVDLLLLELLSVFQWFNPFMWLLRRSVRENHEFLADRAVLTSGVNRGYYKQLLLNQCVGTQLVMANNFNYSLIKNRIKMMSKIKSSKLATTKLVFGLAVAAALVVAFACEQKESTDVQPAEENATVQLTLLDGKIKMNGNSEDIARIKSIFSDNTGFEVLDSAGNTFLKKKEAPLPQTLDKEDQVFFIVEDMPEYPGGEDALRNFIANETQYPEKAQEEGLEGKVYVSFVVTSNGSVANVKVARGVAPLLDSEAVRVVSKLPKWIPGKQRGEAVNVSYTVPINFTLQ